MIIAKEDFYCGSFLSCLLNNGVSPALFEHGDDQNRKIYDFIAGKSDYRVYVKSSHAPSSVSLKNESSIWNFSFTEAQIDEIKEISLNAPNFFFVFVCGEKKLNASKIAIAPKDIIFKCIDLNRKDKYKKQCVKVRFIKGHWDFDFYGTAWSDVENKEDHTLKVRINEMDQVFTTKAQ